MSVQEFKLALEQMTAAERAEVAAYMRILQWKDTPGLTEELGRAHAAMDAGRAISQERIDAFRALAKSAG